MYLIRHVKAAISIIAKKALATQMTAYWEKIIGIVVAIQNIAAIQRNKPYLLSRTEEHHQCFTE